MKNGNDYTSWLQKLETPDIKGNFDQVHPAKLLFGFFQARKTGVLFVNDGVVKFYLYLSQGCLVPYKAGIYEEREYHRYLRSRGIITDEEFYAYSKQAREQGSNFVEFLLQLKITTRSDTEKLADEFYGKNVKGLFSWRHGGYSFYSTILPHLSEKVDQLQMLRTIVDGVREKYHPGMIEARLEKRMRTPLKPYPKSPLPLNDLLVTEQEQQVYEWIRNGATLSYILGESELGATDARALIFALLTINACKFATTAKKRQKNVDKSEQISTIPTDRLARLFSMAEKSVDRIHNEYKDRPPTPAYRERPTADEEIPIETDNMEEELRRRLQDHIQQLKEQRPAVQAPEAAKSVKTVMRTEEPEEPIPMPNASAEEMGELDMGDPFTDGHKDKDETSISDEDELQSMVDREMSEPPADDFASPDGFEEDLAGPDEVDFVLDGESDLKLGEIEDNGEHLIGDADSGLDEGFIEDGAPIQFSDSDPPEHMFQLAVSLIDQEFYGKAHEVIRTALDRGLDNPLAKIYLGLAYYYDRAGDSDRFHKAAQYIQEGIAAVGKDPVGFLTLGKLYLEEGDKAMAELYFIKALEIDRDCIEAKEMIRKIYQER